MKSYAKQLKVKLVPVLWKQCLHKFTEIYFGLCFRDTLQVNPSFAFGKKKDCLFIYSRVCSPAPHFLLSNAGGC